ncbi:MAG: AbgT family transporter [Acidobacteriota bacterium]|nr:AbgT family transporter [Acidobacteriota bacterium]
MTEAPKTKAGFKVPHTLVLLFGMIVAAYILTLVLPQGSFERVENTHGREQVVPGSYQTVEDAERLMPQSIFLAIPEGFGAAAEIIFFVFIIGGAFGIFRATGAADALIGALLGVFGERPWLFVIGGMVLFAVGSSSIGMAEEYLPFVPMLVALAIALKMDAVTGVAVMCVGYGIGYGTALINPFTVFIAQEVADVPQGSGLGFRSALLVIFLIVGVAYVWRYAAKVRADPSASLVADVTPDPALAGQKHPKLTTRHVLILIAIAATIGVLVWGLKFWHWYLVEMGALFAGLGIVLAILGRRSPDRAAKDFCEGAAELTTTALLIGFARAIQVVLDEGQVVDTIIYGMAQPLQGLPPALAAAGMFAVQSLCNLFIPSGSGQAYVTMPLMAPLGDLVGVHRQIAVLAYQFGDGFTNILVPTNAVLVGILAIARIPYDRWLRFILPFMVMVWILGSVALGVAVAIGWTGL